MICSVLKYLLLINTTRILAYYMQYIALCNIIIHDTSYRIMVHNSNVYLIKNLPIFL